MTQSTRNSRIAWRNVTTTSLACKTRVTPPAGRLLLFRGRRNTRAEELINEGVIAGHGCAEALCNESPWCLVWRSPNWMSYSHEGHPPCIAAALWLNLLLDFLESLDSTSLLFKISLYIPSKNSSCKWKENKITRTPRTTSEQSNSPLLFALYLSTKSSACSLC